MQKPLYVKNNHILAVGEVQSGKTAFITDQAIHVQRNMKRPVIILTRVSIDERTQLDQRLDIKNSTLDDPFQYEVVKSTAQIEVSQLKQKKAVVALAHHAYIRRFIEVLKQAQKAANFKAPVLIHDEADLLNSDLPDDQNQVTDALYKQLVELIHCRLSVTATPMSLYAWDKLDQVMSITPKPNYYGLSKIIHVPVNTNPGARSAQSEYDPYADANALTTIMDENLALPESTLLITTSSRTADHENTIKFLRKRYPNVLYLEYNRRDQTQTKKEREPIKVYVPGKKMSKDKRQLSEIMWDYRDYDHIVIVSGLMAGRGISFVAVSPDEPRQFGRHLTSQYFFSSSKRPLDTITQQALRLLGVYSDNPTLKLYTTEHIWKRINNNNVLMSQYIKALRKNKVPISASRANQIVNMAVVKGDLSGPLSAKRKMKNAPLKFIHGKTKTYSAFDGTEDQTLRSTIAKFMTSNYAQHKKFQFTQQQKETITSRLRKTPALKKIQNMKIVTRQYDVWKRGHSGAAKPNEVLIVWNFVDDKCNKFYANKKTTKIPRNTKINIVDIRFLGEEKTESVLQMHTVTSDRKK